MPSGSVVPGLLMLSGGYMALMFPYCYVGENYCKLGRRATCRPPALGLHPPASRPVHPPPSTMASRRHRSISNVQNSQNPPAPPQRTFTPAANNAQQRPLGMLPAVYQSNMKVLLRREPSITAIIDQFSHVCLYHHNGQKWEKHGYEGSMFLFEKCVVPSLGETLCPQTETNLQVHNPDVRVLHPQPHGNG